MVFAVREEEFSFLRDLADLVHSHTFVHTCGWTRSLGISKALTFGRFFQPGPNMPYHESKSLFCMVWIQPGLDAAS
ncbi:hypothetical protein N7491_001574 [Penicillium cf. griseofulvum]|uniref:Uncharacterized protein n=1 Tax=Penicillium cf. griseofulvum TaxID=2972120 RepID=A0A9W9JCG5_9EURO|nr:hypothetical protein N7472_006704 [Penicillium cf. griseofulvum]KAJ5445492.1 hypothetical protein N7491_001574 [Penicillium cf. griseofulvum]KAJ5447212.1 hypothetical protein N7445_002033 [Penicillium cf. griseofulvum]